MALGRRSVRPHDRWDPAGNNANVNRLTFHKSPSEAARFMAAQREVTPSFV
jgi:hypothetical protein